jgi:glycosyltransferase involved in cell wall biosynthesis
VPLKVDVNNKYTVIIPTRDRAETLAATLRTCIRQTYDNFHIIVSDNCSNDNTRQIVDGFKDPRIKYINPGYRLSMADHFEFALNHVADGFVMFIGSDDGLMVNAVEYVNSIVESKNVNAVSCRQATYIWPDFPDLEASGLLVFGDLGDGIEIRKSRDWIRKALSFESQYCFDLPNLYCGFVHRDVINKAFSGGRYFESITPDAYSAFATAIFVREYAFSYKPFVIAGASTKSNGASSMSESADSMEAIKFNTENNLTPAHGFVHCPSFEITLAEAFSKLAEKFSTECSNYSVDYKKMLLYAIKNSNLKTRDRVLAAVDIIAKNFSINVGYPVARLSLYRLHIKKLWLVFCILISHPSRVVSIRNSALLGIYDVDAASLAANSFINAKDSPLILSAKTYYLRKFKRLSHNFFRGYF